MKYIGKFDPLKNEMVEVMDKTGKIIHPELMPEISNEDVLKAYKLMNLSRRQDQFQNTMQRQGRLLSFLTSTGQEAAEVAYTMVLDPKVDWFLSGYRNAAAWLTMGQLSRNIMLYWAGNELGGKAPDGINLTPPEIVIGTQFSQATGIGFAQKYLKKPGIVVTTTGDGGMSEGETYEAMNFAKLHEVPVVFISENNQWAISTPVVEQTKSLNMAVKAVASGIPSIKVDGNDFFASYGVAKETSEYVKTNGPFFVEYYTYRLGAHSSSDSPDVYRPKAQFEEAETFDPLPRLKAWLINNHLWDEEQQAALDQEQDSFLEKEFKWVEAHEDYDLAEIFKYQYAQETENLEEQYAEAKAFFDQHPKA